LLQNGLHRFDTSETKLHSVPQLERCVDLSGEIGWILRTCISFLLVLEPYSPWRCDTSWPAPPSSVCRRSSCCCSPLPSQLDKLPEVPGVYPSLHSLTNFQRFQEFIASQAMMSAVGETGCPDRSSSPSQGVHANIDHALASSEGDKS